MMKNHNDQDLAQWLNPLGYSEIGADLITSEETIPRNNAFAPELKLLLDGSVDSAIAAVALVDQSPAVCFVSIDPDLPGNEERIAAIRRAVWNQNLVSLILVVSDHYLYPYSAIPDLPSPSPIQRKHIAQAKPYFYREMASGALLELHPEWFDRKNRVDKKLLRNLDQSVKLLAASGVEKLRAQYLLGQSLFISYLEHRGIVGSEYQAKHRVKSLHELVRSCNLSGLTHYIQCLKKSFNGDFLAPEIVGLAGWAKLDSECLNIISDFLAHTDLASGQQSLWAYDFRYIPVELISGIYETFLSEDKDLVGAYYTPRNLAAFTVDQAFEHSTNIADEIVYDGACGSGILLVTAFRRMLSAAEALTGEPLSFIERCDLLVGHIRGSDINKAACMVTAFSLYLSLLENLRPSDLTLIGGDDHKAKLPKLLEVILWSGESEGDFFSKKLMANKAANATIFISNPPWREPKSAEKGLSYEAWAAHPERSWHLPHRQIAAAFSHRALDVIPVGGRACLILPAKLFLSATSQDFVEQFIQRCQLKRVVCFADVRLVLFPEAIHPCVVVLAEKIPDDAIPEQPLFDYWVPKADVSIAYGRLNIHGTDRHQLPLGLVAHNNQALRTYLWGGAHDQALMLRLSRFGSLKTMVTRQAGESEPRWIDGKGFHLKDSHVEPKKPGFLKKMLHLDARSTPLIPVMPASLLTKFPADYKDVASYGAHDGNLFTGPRVVLNDGVDCETFEAKAVFSNIPFSFKSSIGAFAGPEEDEDLFRFLAVYLRSSLARYLMLMSSYALTVERQRISMAELKSLPFILPEKHPNPKKAARIIREIATKSRALEKLDEINAFNKYANIKLTFDNLVSDYFDLTDKEIQVVNEAANILIPSIQPSWKNLGKTPLLSTLSDRDLTAYIDVLTEELQALSRTAGGTADIQVSALAETTGGFGAVGICRISLGSSAGGNKNGFSKVELAIAWLRRQELLPVPVGESFSLTSDFLFFYRNEIYLIKPLIARFWLHGQAQRDALRILKATRQHSKGAAYEQ